MKDSDLRWKISSLLAGTPNYEIVDLLFSAIPRQHLEEMLRRKKPAETTAFKKQTKSIENRMKTALWLDRSIR